MDSGRVMSSSRMLLCLSYLCRKLKNSIGLALNHRRRHFIYFLLCVWLRRGEPTRGASGASRLLPRWRSTSRLPTTSRSLSRSTSADSCRWEERVFVCVGWLWLIYRCWVVLSGNYWLGSGKRGGGRGSWKSLGNGIPTWEASVLGGESLEGTRRVCACRCHEEAPPPLSPYQRYLRCPSLNCRGAEARRAVAVPTGGSGRRAPRDDEGAWSLARSLQCCFWSMKSLLSARSPPFRPRPLYLFFLQMFNK